MDVNTLLEQAEKDKGEIVADLDRVDAEIVNLRDEKTKLKSRLAETERCIKSLTPRKRKAKKEASK